MDDVTPEAYLGVVPEGVPTYECVHGALTEVFPDVTVRVSRSQVAFRRARGFAYLWLPGRYLHHPRTDLVLSIALPRPIASSRFAEVAHPSPRVWMHHLDIHSADDVDDQVRDWLVEAGTSAG